MAKLVTDRLLLPYLFKRIGKHNLVQFIDPEALDWSQGFFKLALPSEEKFDDLMPFDEWLAGEENEPSDYQDVSAIFHVSRCGSTLLSENLKATGDTFVLSEPPFFRILRHKLGGTVDYDTALRASLAMLQAWKRWSMNRSSRLLVKFNSQLHLDQCALFERMRGARFLFLYREPLAVLESLQRKPPAYLHRETAQERIPLVSDLANVACDPIVLAGANRYCTALDTFSGVAREECLFVEYPELERRFGEILGHLGFDPSSAPNWSAVHDAKADQSIGPKVYQAVAPERFEQFAAENKDVLSAAQRRFEAFAAVQSSSMIERADV